jgi:hypothetical protein
VRPTLYANATNQAVDLIGVFFWSAQAQSPDKPHRLLNAPLLLPAAATARRIGPLYPKNVLSASWPALALACIVRFILKGSSGGSLLARR